MAIRPYKQSFTHSCLAVCFLMLLQTQKRIDVDRENEKVLLERGSDRKYPFYVVGISQEFSKMFGKDVEIFVDNTYFTRILKKDFCSRSRCKVRRRKITTESIRDYLKKGPMICHIDDHTLGDYSHCSHFVILEKELQGEKVLVVDPWTGKRKRLGFDRLNQSILSLKKHIKMCPLLLRIVD